MDPAEPKCIAFGGVVVDEEIGRQVLRVIEPEAVEAAILADSQQDQQQDEVRRALERDLQAARYTVRRAGKQFDACDPDNRLVADELKRRWNATLQHVSSLEQRPSPLQSRTVNSAEVGGK